MALTERLAVIIDANSGGAVREFNKATAAAGKFSKEAETQRVTIGRLSMTHDQLAAGLKAGIATAAVSAAYGLVRLGKASIAAASDLNETQSKVKVVFGASADAVLDFGQTAATALGQSEQQAEEAAATFGNLFVSMKIGQPTAAKMSTSLVQLASDLASFNNLDPTEALEALRSGLVGETEPLRRFGVNLNDATLKQEALRQGLVTTTTGTLPAAAKAQAAYALILKQTATAQGDFARTSDGLANQQRTMTAQVKDAEAALGKNLLPVELELVHLTNGYLIPAFKTLGTALQNDGVRHLLEFGAALYGVNKGIKVYKAVQGSDLIGLLKKVAVGHTVNTVAITAEGAAATRTAAQVETLAAAEATAGRAGFARLAAGLGPVGALTAGFALLGTTISGIVESHRLEAFKNKLVDAATSGEEGLRKVNNTFTVLDKFVKKNGDGVGGLARKMRDAAASAVAEGRANTDLADTHEKVADAAKEAEQAEQDLLDARIASFNSAIGYKRSLLDVADSLAAVKQAAKEGNQEEYRKSVLDAKDALLGEAAAAVQMAQDNKEAEGKTLSARAAQRVYRDELKKLAGDLAPGSPLRKYLRGLIDDLNEAGKDRHSNIYIDTHYVAGSDTSYAPGTHRRVEHAMGGPVYGPGTGTSDSIPAMLSNGEYVVRADGSNLTDALTYFGRTSPTYSTTNKTSAPVINVTYAKPERVSDAIPRVLREAAYVQGLSW